MSSGTPLKSLSAESSSSSSSKPDSSAGGGPAAAVSAAHCDAPSGASLLRPVSAPVPRPSVQPDGAKSTFAIFTGSTARPGTTLLARPAAPSPSTTAASPFSASAIGGLPASSSSISQTVISKPIARTKVTDASATETATATSAAGNNAMVIPIVQSAVSTAPMASIIRGPVAHGQQISHVHLAHPAVQATYSSHVPRGAAAVACITTLKSAVATPIPRTSHIYPSNVISGGLATHPSLQVRSPSLPALRSVPRTVAPAVSLSDIHRAPQPMPAVANTLSAAKLVIASSPRGAMDVRQTLVHPAGMVPRAQPFLQQLPEKGFYRQSFVPTTLLPISTVQITTTAPSVTSQAKPVLSVGHPLPAASSHLLPHPQLVAHASLPAAAASIGAFPAAASLIATGVSPPPPQSHAHLPKVIAQAIHTVGPVPHLQPVGGSSSNSSLVLSATRPAVTTAVVVTHSLPRPIVSTGASIPVAKVYPQPLNVATRPEIAPHQELSRTVPTTALFLSPTQRCSPGVSIASTATATLPGNVVGAGVSAAASSMLGVAEAKSERTQVQSATTYTIPSGATAYYYESYQGVAGPTLAMHSFPSTAGTHPFASISSSALRPGLPIHATAVRAPISNATPVTISPMIVSVNAPRHSFALPSAALTSTADPSGMGSTESTAVLTTAVVAATTAVVVSTTTATGSFSPFAGSPVHTGVAGGGLSVTPSSSPRPSILRKRAVDGSNAAVRKNLLSSLPCSQPPSPHHDSSGSNATVGSSSSSSPKSAVLQRVATHDSATPLSEGNDSCNGMRALDVVIKQEPMDTFESTVKSTAVNASPAVGVEASPRKKPRKQQLTGNELVELHSTEGEDDFEKDSRDVPKKEFVKEDDAGVSWVLRRKRPPVAMLNSYRHSWKSRHNHFLRYTDIKLKEERRPTVVDLSNQKGVVQKANGWKMYHICAQIEDLTEMETSVHTRLTDLLENMVLKASSKGTDDLNFDRANELVRGNLQRCKIIRDQMRDARQQILRVLDHKSRVLDIVTQHVSKNTSRKREKN